MAWRGRCYGKKRVTGRCQGQNRMAGDKLYLRGRCYGKKWVIGRCQGQNWMAGDKVTLDCTGSGLCQRMLQKSMISC